MYCSQCGKSCPPDAKFCANCGARVDTTEDVTQGTAIGAPPAEQHAFERVFLDSAGVVVTEAVFKTGTGSSYPIRNISSVLVVKKPAGAGVIVFASAFLLLGFFMLLGSAPVGLFFLVIAALFIANIVTQPYQLQVGSGGVNQVAISSKNEAELRRIAAAINEAVLNLQRGT